MNPNITQENLIRFIYNELSPSQCSEIQEIIQADSKVKQDYDSLLMTLQELKPIEIHTDQGSKNMILKYSKNVSSMEASI